MRRLWLKHMYHTGPAFSVEVCCCWGYWESGLISGLETRNRTVTFLLSSKCHKVGRLNKITGILSFHRSLGVLYKYLCHDSKIAAADWFKQQFYSWQWRGAAATGILSGVSMLPALQNGQGSNLNPAHFYCASMPTLEEKNAAACLILREPEEFVWSARVEGSWTAAVKRSRIWHISRLENASRAWSVEVGTCAAVPSLGKWGGNAQVSRRYRRSISKHDEYVSNTLHHYFWAVWEICLLYIVLADLLNSNTHLSSNTV